MGWVFIARLSTPPIGYLILQFLIRYFIHCLVAILLFISWLYDRWLGAFYESVWRDSIKSFSQRAGVLILFITLCRWSAPALVLYLINRLSADHHLFLRCSRSGILSISAQIRSSLTSIILWSALVSSLAWLTSSFVTSICKRGGGQAASLRKSWPTFCPAREICGSDFFLFFKYWI